MSAAPQHDPFLVTRRRLRRRDPWRAFAPVVSSGLLGLAFVLVMAGLYPTVGAGLGTLLAASVSVFAAYVSYRLKQEDDARLDERRRVEEQLGVASALIAEIEDNKRAAEEVHSQESIAGVWRRMRDDPGHLPFLVEDEGGNEVYRAVIGKLVLLPEGVVVPVVRYYAADTTLNESIAAWRSPDFRALCDPADPRSVGSGRPRQLNFIMWTLLSICDVYAVDLPPDDPGVPPDPELQDFIEGYQAGRAARVAAAPELAVPHADAALAALRDFVRNGRACLELLDADIAAAAPAGGAVPPGGPRAG